MLPYEFMNVGVDMLVMYVLTQKLTLINKIHIVNAFNVCTYTNANFNK